MKNNDKNNKKALEIALLVLKMIDTIICIINHLL